MEAKAAEDDLSLVAAVSGTPVEELRKASAQAIAVAIEACNALMTQRPRRMHHEFKLEGKRFVFIPSWEDFTAGEYADAEFFCSDLSTMAHEFLSVMYRPLAIDNRFRKKLEPYDKPIYAEAFKALPADVLGGTFLFFYVIDEAYRNGILRSLAAAAIMNSAVNMGGITRFTSWRARMQHAWTKWRNGRLKGR